MQTLRRTPLYERHAALGARLVPFAGWEMPVQYAGISEEHRAVRSRAGVFDVSHMGELRLAGDGSRDYLQARLSNDLDRVGAGQAQYTLLTNQRGGIVDDLIAYRRGDDDYLLVVNAANVDADHAALAETEDVSDSWAYLAVQGPEALERLGVEIEPFAFREDVDVRRARVRARMRARGRGRHLGRGPGPGHRALRARRSGHVAPRGLLPAARQ